MNEKDAELTLAREEKEKWSSQDSCTLETWPTY